MITDRIELAKHFKKKGFVYGAEVGTADGRYAEILCQEIPGLQLYCIDPYMKYEGNWRSNDYQQKAYETAMERLSTFNAKILRTTGVEASLKIMDEVLDFVFIDGDHQFDSVMTDIILWSKKVKKGGIVSGHDYYQFGSGGVVEAVNAYAQSHGISINLTLQGVAEHKDDKCPCWWFIKE